jgi:hypothetical protein
LKRSEENENYEFAEIIKDIKLNYDKLVEMNTASIKPNTTTKRTITVTNKSNENKD